MGRTPRSFWSGSIVGLLAVCGPGCEPDRAGEARSEVATTYTIGQFNMAGGNAGETGDLHNEPADRLIESIRMRNPAFVTIQEGCSDWSEYMDARLDDYTVVFDGVNDKFADPATCKHDRTALFGNAILFRDDFGIDGAPVPHPLLSPAGREQREMLCLPSNSRRIVLCSIHLSSNDDDFDDAENEEARNGEASIARTILAERYAGYTKLVGGDLNDLPTEEFLGIPVPTATDKFYASGYGRGAAGEFKEVDSPCGNNIREDFVLGRPCRSGEDTTGSGKIDYLFVSPEVFVLGADASPAIHSDHAALWASVIIGDDGGGDGGDDGGDGGDGGEPVDRPPFVEAGPKVSGPEGSDIVLGGFASDIEGPISVSWSFRALSEVDPGTTCAFGHPDLAQTTFRCTDDGIFELTLTASDGVNAAVSDETIAIVRNAPPELTVAGPLEWAVLRAGQTEALSAGFVDPGSNDTHTCSIDWDDGVTESIPAATSCDRSHVYEQAGMYSITTTVTDDDGGSDSDRRLLIVYDPDAGFVTGGGLVESPAGALAARSDVAGAAHFNLNPAYRPHEQGPSAGNGKLSFDLRAAGLDLASTALDWLVVTRDGKAAVKGAATLDGEPGFGFVAYATSDHRFRLVVWRLADGDHPAEQIVFDSRRGADFDLDEAEPPPITSGSIQIHR